MKNVLYTLIVAAVLVGCSARKYPPVTNNDHSNGAVANDTIRIANDSLEYEIIIIEPGFNAWLARQLPRGYYSQSALEISNKFKVLTYNLRARNQMQYDPNLYPFVIDYKSNIDYGYEVNYLLYNYFLFFEQRYNQRL